MSEPAASDHGEVAADPFAMESAIEFRPKNEPIDQPDGSSVGQLWFSYAAKAALGDLAG